MDTTTTDRALYRLMAWLSPAFPVGGFSYSHALEYAVEAGRVSGRGGLLAYVKVVLAQGSARSDATLFCAAWRAVGRDDPGGFLAAVERAEAMRGTAELALECLAQGTAFLATIQAAWPELEVQRWAALLARASRCPAYPVAVALVAAAAGIPLAPALTAYLQAMAAGIIAAGIKLIPLGQTDGQRAIAGLEPAIEAAVAAALGRSLDDIGSAAPLIDLWSMRHESQYTRLFRS